MRRRDVLRWIGGAAAWTLPARAQTPVMPVIGYLAPESPRPFASRLKAFRDGLAEAGYVEGRNVAIEYRWAEGNYTRLPALAADLAGRKVAVLVASGGAPAALAAKTATKTITIVFEMGGDPVALGVVDSLSRPGGNLTGISSLSVEVSRKRLEFMHELRPNAASFAVAVNPTSPTSGSQVRNLQMAAEALGVRLHIMNASTEGEFEAMFLSATREQAGGIVFTSDPYFAFRSTQLADLCLRYSMPAVTQSRDFPTAGGLMSYGGDFMQSHRRAGSYAGRVLNGEKPSDLPVQLVTKVELVINLKTAKALSINIPPALISSADTVIE
ncbi:ABC transporter substrate-binding protein [Microvirga terrestris]|uniref:ABC transporter substrate-binding protein n=1 Tax=Microvirga terrestris TaxID=2791024 RepID=A0ABS0HUX5_9HYPH|nr:ABC transporter substrate-binding protein [Microvirga terrestris]MBF9197287.1 ABC transporter substrate-binding protein [Microvirga terrestris]